MVNEYQYNLEGDEATPVSICVVEIPADKVASTTLLLAKRLVPKRYYAHFVAGNLLYVVFPMCVYLVIRGDRSSAEHCRLIGRMFDIPDEQMPFEGLFEDDHPKG